MNLDAVVQALRGRAAKAGIPLDDLRQEAELAALTGQHVKFHLLRVIARGPAVYVPYETVRRRARTGAPAHECVMQPYCEWGREASSGPMLQEERDREQLY